MNRSGKNPFNMGRGEWAFFIFVITSILILTLLAANYIIQ
jgi:hypothetical protein